MDNNPDDFGHLDFERVVSWCLPAFPLVKNEHSLPAIYVAIIATIANNIKRQGEVVWNEPLATKMAKWNLLRGKETYDDLRLNLIIVGDAGSGKTGLMKGISNLNPYKSVFIQSTPQYDQMIGSVEKWQENKKWKYEVFPGQLASDIFLMDEALSIYIDERGENKKIRELLRTALSRIGTNMINKPMVKVPEQFQCNYYPEITLIQGFPAQKVPVSLIAEGDVRRAQILCLNFPLSEKEATKRFGLDVPEVLPPSPMEYETARKFLGYLRQKKFKIWISPTTENYVKDAMGNLKVFTANYGLKASWYFRTAYFDLESQLYRYGTVMSIIRDSTRDVIDVSIEDIQVAWKYFSSVYADSLVWINNYTTGDWAVAMLKEADIEKVTAMIEWLKGLGAWTSADTTTTVDDMKIFMVNKRWFSTLNGSKRFYQSLLEKGVIRSGRRGRKWFVWIGPKGKEIISESGVEVPW